MLHEAVADLLAAPPHEPDRARLTPAEWVVYRDGYRWALVMALRTMTAAEQRFQLYARTRRLEAKRRRGEKSRA